MKSVAEFPEQALGWLKLRSDDWPVYPLKRVVDCNKSALSDRTDPDYEIKYVDISSVGLSEGVKKAEELKFENAPSRARRIVRDGDVLVSTVRTYLRAIARIEKAPENLIASTGFAVLSPQEKLDSTYFGLFCTAHPFVEAIVAQSTGASYPATNASDIVRLPIPVPPLEVQRQIASFIEKKIKEIDDLIAKKRELLKLLAEKRSALITRAVTKGLDPNAAMKPSGIDWLGDIPADWDARRLRFIGRAQNGINIGGDAFGKGFPFVSYSDVFKNFDLPSEPSGLVESSETDRKRYSVRRGDVFFTRTSETIEEIGMSAVCLESIPDATFAGFVIRMRPWPETLLPEFSKYYFRNATLRAFLVKEMNLVTRASLSQTLLGNVPVLLPILGEQAKIVEFIDAEVGKIDSVSKAVEVAIATLNEYRAAIITKAVTGELEVA